MGKGFKVTFSYVYGTVIFILIQSVLGAGISSDLSGALYKFMSDKLMTDIWKQYDVVTIPLCDLYRD